MRNLKIFHFNCSICGSHPPEENLSVFLNSWLFKLSKDRVAHLFSIFVQILNTISKRRWMTSECSKTIEDEIIILKFMLGLLNIEHSDVGLFHKDSNNNLFALFDCPICKISKGPRENDKFFNEWESADKVQVSNFLYEAGIVIFAIAKKFPSWANVDELKTFKRILQLNRQCQEMLGLLECSFCRRFTSCLYGDGTEVNPYRCKWCLDEAGGGNGIEITFDTKKDFDDNFSDHMEEYLYGLLDKQEFNMHVKDHLSFHVNNGIPKEKASDDVVPKPQNE